MRMHTCGHHAEVTETSKMINFWGRFVYILDSNPIHRYNVFLLVEAGYSNQQNNHPTNLFHL